LDETLASPLPDSLLSTEKKKKANKQPSHRLNEDQIQQHKEMNESILWFKPFQSQVLFYALKNYGLQRALIYVYITCTYTYISAILEIKTGKFL
jgi:hypothetical protein